MAYIKSISIGVLMFFLATIAYIAVATAVVRRTYRIPPGTHVALTLRWLFGSPLYWLISIAAFALGFYWSFHRSYEI